MSEKALDPADFIEPLNMNGLQGRMLRLPTSNPKHNKEILVVYGHHALLERWWGLLQNFNAYGNVTMPDLPGFGGMDSFYKIGQKPSIDNLADYLASFIKWRYKRRKVVIFGISFGFVVATRMLQRYPELCKKVDFLVSGVGFARYDDFRFSKRRMLFYRIIARLIYTPGFGVIYRLTLNPWVLRKAYARTHNAKKKFEIGSGGDPELFNKMMDMEIVLWQVNDPKTYGYTSWQFLHLDNCKKQINLPVWHVCVKGDMYFDNDTVEQHLRVIFNDVHVIKLNEGTHAPSVIATKKESAIFLPPKLRKVFSRKFAES